MANREKSNLIPVYNKDSANEGAVFYLLDASGNVIELESGEDGLLVNIGALKGENSDINRMMTAPGGSGAYFATAGDNKVIKATPGFLYGIIVGKDVASSIIEVSDHASDGDGNIKIHVEGSTLMTQLGGYMPVNKFFAVGICADLDNQTNVTFVFI